MRRVIGAGLTILGVLAVVFVPVGGVGGCAECVKGYDGPLCGCHDYGSYSFWGFHYPPGWDKLALPMLIIGVALVVTGTLRPTSLRPRSPAPSWPTSGEP
jgi:hypothetical protein